MQQRTPTIVLLGIALVLASLLACRSRERSKLPAWKVGGLYSIRSGEGDFVVAKVLALDPGVVGVRIYKQKFQSRPVTVDPSSLTLGSVKDPDGFGLGHIPVPEEGFASWEPQLLLVQGVTDAELEGYRYWKDAQGGK